MVIENSAWRTHSPLMHQVGALKNGGLPTLVELFHHMGINRPKTIPNAVRDARCHSKGATHSCASHCIGCEHAKKCSDPTADRNRVNQESTANCIDFLHVHFAYCHLNLLQSAFRFALCLRRHPETKAAGSGAALPEISYARPFGTSAITRPAPSIVSLRWARMTRVKFNSAIVFTMRCSLESRVRDELNAHWIPAKYASTLNGNSRRLPTPPAVLTVHRCFHEALVSSFVNSHA